jgi:hypothetical protein
VTVLLSEMDVLEYYIDGALIYTRFNYCGMLQKNNKE